MSLPAFERNSVNRQSAGGDESDPATLVREAAARIAGAVRRTPLVEAGEFGGAHVRLKLECMQLAGSFKARGALNRVLGDATASRCVVTASGGNHGVAVAAAASLAGLEALVYVPASTPPLKASLIENAGASVVRVNGPFGEAERLAREHASREHAVFVHPFDDPLVVAGQGTLGLEIVESWPSVDLIVVAVGGGGLAAGLVQALAGRAAVLTVEPERCPTLHQARVAGRPVPVEVGGVAVDSLGAPMLGEIAWRTLRDESRDPVLVPDDAIVDAQLALWRDFRIVAEPAGACGWAALQTLDPHALRGRDVAVVVCGANVDLQGLSGP